MPFEGKPDSRPRLVIPYWPPGGNDPGDTGDIRPVPTTIPWYVCAGIRTSTYLPGAQLEVVVDIRNLGGSTVSSLAEVTVWWTDPTLGFLITPENLFGFRQVPVPPRGGTNTTTVMTKQIPAGAPPHICLLARVSHRDDPAPATPDPIIKRHWAQRNLAVVKAPAGGTVVLPVLVANQLTEGATFQISMRLAEHAQLLLGVDGVEGRPLVDVRPQFTLGGVSGESVIEVDVELAAGEVQRLEAVVHVVDLDVGDFVVVEIGQSQDGRLIGGLGLVLQGG